ncbi:MAG: D-2-hydroxyacid dehydrogenase, partial [Verrucomicrobia bacterium]|nr:D-2-hydroxyacid dehydrogenase [Verrucomicrobiota bacterium]
MNLVVLDGFTLNPGDLSWAGLKSLGPCAIHDRTPPADLLARAAEAEILLTNKTPLAHDTIQRLPRHQYTGVLATGT